MVKTKEYMRSYRARKPLYVGGRPETGQRMILSYARNTVSAEAPSGIDVGRSIEPSGRYMNVSATYDLNDHKVQSTQYSKWEYGYIEFDNPLVLEHVSTGSNGWKRTLSDMYGGKTGKRLSAAVISDGYDAIVTIDSQSGEHRGEWFDEVIDLGGKETTRRRFKKAVA